MKKVLFIYIIFVFVSIVTRGIASSEEFTKETIQRMLKEEQFEKLDTLAEEIRKSRKILDNGGSALSRFYNDLTENYDKEKEIIRLINLCEKWKRAYPNSPTPLIALSALYRDYAWQARGSGWAGTITNEQWDLFYERMKKADEYANNKIAERDMRSYVERIKNIKLIGGEDTKNKAYAVLDKGIAIDPDYHSMYFVMAELLMERWYGDNKYEMISFINKYSAKRKGVEGNILYIKSLLHMSYFYERFNYLNRMGVSWAVLEGKLKSVLREQPENKFIWNAYWYFAGMALDLERAEELGKKLDNMNGWITDSWWDPLFYKSNMIKSLVERRNQIAVFTLNVLDIWHGESNLVEYYEFLDSEGKKIGGAGGNKETLTFTDINLNYEPYKIVRYVIVPNTLLKDKISIKYIIENPNSDKKIEAVKTLSFTKSASDGKEAAGFWNTNLLKNPSAEHGAKDWIIWGKGGTIKSDALRSGDVFYTEDFLDTKSHLYKNINLPLDVADAYVAVAGYLSADKVVEGSISRRPYLHGYFIFEENRINGYLQNDSLMYSCKTKCWQARAGIFKIPPKTESITFFLDHGIVRGDAPDGSRSYYDDLELRVFKTSQEAEEFIDSYKQQHPILGEGKVTRLGEEKVTSPWNKNLLRNLSANSPLEGWFLSGKGGVVESLAGKKGNIFYTTDFSGIKSHFFHDIVLSLDAADAYVAIAGYLSSEEAITGSESKKPYLHGYFMYKKNRIISNLRAKTMDYDCQANCWQARWGIFKIPSETETIRVFLDYSVVKGVDSNISRFYYNDIELRLFKTLKEAEEFINNYKGQHPQVQH